MWLVAVCISQPLELTSRCGGRAGAVWRRAHRLCGDRRAVGWQMPLAFGKAIRPALFCRTCSSLCFFRNSAAPLCTARSETKQAGRGQASEGQPQRTCLRVC